jgi:hypothetical protein
MALMIRTARGTASGKTLTTLPAGTWAPASGEAGIFTGF